MKFSQKSFTLLELLVVIAIIAILAGIVIASVVDLRQRAKESKGMQFSQNIRTTLSNELVGEWKFNEGEGTVAKDTSGEGNNGTWGGTGSHWTDGKVSGAGQFNGINDYVKIDNVIVTNPTSLTISSWFNKRGQGANYECVLHKSVNTSIGSSEYWMGVDLDDYLTATIGAITGVGWAAGRTTIKATSGSWYYLVASWDGSVVKVYINGDYIKKYNLTSYTSLVTPTRFGASSDGVSYQFNGLVDEVRIYKEALSAKQIKKIYTESRRRHLADH
jgi:prepilin-type N-terminal cleavage/methylation domain-containing protein